MGARLLHDWSLAVSLARDKAAELLGICVIARPSARMSRWAVNTITLSHLVCSYYLSQYALEDTRAVAAAIRQSDTSQFCWRLIT